MSARHSITPLPASSHPRRGAILLVALVCVCVASALVVALAQLARTHHDASRTVSRRVQADWLAESGLERAVAALAANPAYRGETWRIPAEALGGKDGAAVMITVEPLAGQASRCHVHVQADYPDDPHRRARQSKHIVVEKGEVP